MARDAQRESNIGPTPGVDLEKRIAELAANDDQIRDAVRAAKIGTDEDIPHLSASLIDKYVADIKHLGLLANDEGKSA